MEHTSTSDGPHESAAPILLLSDAPGGGGAEVYLSILADALATQRRFLAIVGDDFDIGSRAALLAAGVGIRTSRAVARKPSPRQIIALALEIARSGAALAHVNATDQGDAAGLILAARLARVPTLVTLHLFVPGRARWRNRVSGSILQFADTVIAVSKSVGDELAAIGVEAVVVQNGVSAPKPAVDARATLGLNPDSLVIGGLGRLTEQKGWDILCRAAMRIRAGVKNVEFVILGEGGERAALEALARPGRVRLPGAREDASSLLHAFDLLVCPSRWEGLPLVPIEAMRAGVPVVGSAIPALREVLGDAGVIVPPEDADALADAVIDLLEDPERRAKLAAAGRARAERRFTVERMAEQTLSAYLRLGA